MNKIIDNVWTKDPTYNEEQFVMYLKDLFHGSNASNNYGVSWSNGSGLIKKSILSLEDIKPEDLVDRPYISHFEEVYLGSHNHDGTDWKLMGLIYNAGIRGTGFDNRLETSLFQDLIFKCTTNAYKPASFRVQGTLRFINYKMGK